VSTPRTLVTGGAGFLGSHLCERLLEEARASLGDDPSELQLRVLNRATDLYEIGVRRLEAGYKRGGAALWRSSTMSAWLIG